MVDRRRFPSHAETFYIMSYALQDFEKDVIERSRTTPVLVDFWAEWCGPCKMLAPVIEGLAERAGERWALVKVNTEEHPELAERYGISSIPNVKLFFGGEVMDEFFGAMSESEIQSWIDGALPSPNARTMLDARARLEAGDVTEAIRLAEPILAEEPGNHDVRMLIAEASLGSEPSRVEELLEPLREDSDHFDRAQALRKLAKVALVADAPEDLPEGAARDLYLDGAKAVRNGDYDAAFGAFVAAIEKQRDYSEEASQTAGKAMIQFLGIRHPTVDKNYRAFTSVLYS